MISQTSLDAYSTINDLGKKQQIVYETIEELGGATNEQISRHLGWQINRVTGRVNELYKLNMLEVTGVRPNVSGKSAKVWSVVEERSND